MAQQQAAVTVDLPARITRAASIVPNTVNVEARTVDVIWTTGARVLRGYWERYWEELSLDPKHVRLKRLNNGAPMLNAHDDASCDCVIGVVQPGSAMVDGKKGTATVRFASAGVDPMADRIFAKVVDGVIQNISVGYATYRMEKIEDGADKIPVYRATDWEPMELSPVPIGADDGAGFRSESSERIKCTFITRQHHQEQPTMADTDPTPTPSGESAAVAATRAAQQQRIEDAKREAAIREEATQAAQAAERARSSAIRTLARQHGMGDIWAQQLVDAGTTVDAARAAVLTDLASRDAEVPIGGSVRVNAGDDERDKWFRGAAASLWSRYGFTDLVRAGKAKLPDHPAFKEMKEGDLDPGEFRGLKPIDLARQSLERYRVNTRGMDEMPLVGHAFTFRNPGNFQTTADFAVLLEVAFNKVLLGGYATQESTYQLFCKETEIKDFRTSPQYRTGSLPGLLDINEHGEYKSGAIPDAAKYTIQTGRKGIKFSISREVIVNDDMGAMLQLASGFGQASKRTLENNVYALLTANSGLGATQADTNPFFHSSRNNINATGSALSVAGLDADRVQLRTQKDPASLDFLDLRPDILLVPDSLYGQALVINEAQYDTDKIANGRQQEPNRVRGLFRQVIGTPRLTGTRRYIFAQTGDALVIAYLLGYSRAPNIESVNGWNIDGVEYRVTLYARAQTGDAKGAVTNAGV